MSRIGKTFRAPLGLTVACLLALSCSTLAPRTDPTRPTALMKEAGATMSPLEVRQRLDDVERLAMMRQLDEERVAAMADADQLGQGLLAAAVVQAFRVVDHPVWRLAQLLGGLLLLAAFLGWILMRMGRVHFVSDGRGLRD